MSFEQHSCEMAMNSADPYHFLTLHGPLPIPCLEKFVYGKHSIRAWYGEGIVGGSAERTKSQELAMITECTEYLYLFRRHGWRVPFSAAAAQSIKTTVTFEGSGGWSQSREKERESRISYPLSRVVVVCTICVFFLYITMCVRRKARGGGRPSKGWEKFCIFARMLVRPCPVSLAC